MNGPILITPDFTKQFKLAVDASDVGVGAVLFQEVSDVDKPISFFSKNLISIKQIILLLKKNVLLCCLLCNILIYIYV